MTSERLEYKRTTGGRLVRKATRLSRKRKKWLRRHAPFGVAMDPVVLGNPERRWGRDSFIAEEGHAKSTWRKLWALWNPGAHPMWRNGRFVRTEAWFVGKEHRIPRRLRAAIRPGALP